MKLMISEFFKKFFSLKETIRHFLLKQRCRDRQVERINTRIGKGYRDRQSEGKIQ